jgi:hypothetical protein
MAEEDEWWGTSDLAPPVRSVEREVQIEPNAERAAHVRQVLLMPRGFWRGASLWLVIRTYEDDGRWTAEESWRMR